METKVIKEEPMFILSYDSYNSSDEVSIYVSDLKAAKVGTVFSALQDNCGRGQTIETVEVIHKTDEGCAVLFRRYGTTDSPNPKEWANTPELIWIEFGRSVLPWRYPHESQ